MWPTRSFEEELDNLLRDDEDFHHVADALMDQIANRFETLPPGKEVRKTRQGWPLSWSGEWPVENRAEFLRAISLFSSNYAPLFGRLLTPLVNGVRVAGPFVPKWSGDQAPKLVLLDGEGLGHTPRSSSAVSTAVSRQIRRCRCGTSGRQCDRADAGCPDCRNERNCDDG